MSNTCIQYSAKKVTYSANNSTVCMPIFEYQNYNFAEMLDTRLYQKFISYENFRNTVMQGICFSAGPQLLVFQSWSCHGRATTKWSVLCDPH